MQTHRELQLKRGSGHDSVGHSRFEDRRKPVFDFMKGFAMFRTNFAVRIPLAASLT
jgi:hypothetical protein